MVVSTAGVWLAPMLVAPPLFTRDVFSHLAQGTLPLRGQDPHQVGPDVLGNVLSKNIHYFWQGTSAALGPLFILLPHGMAWT